MIYAFIKNFLKFQKLYLYNENTFLINYFNYLLYIALNY